MLNNNTSERTSIFYSHLSKNPGAILLDTVIHQKQAIADTSGQSATVWDISGRPASESASEYENYYNDVLLILNSIEFK